MPKKIVLAPFLIVVIMGIVAAIVKWDLYENMWGQHDTFNFQNNIRKILLQVNESRRVKQKKGSAWSKYNQPLNREVMRYIILCGPGSERMRSNPGFCKKSSQFYQSLNERNFDKGFLPLDERSSISDINSIIIMTDEFTIYRKYIERMIPPNPSPKELLEAELSYIHMFREKDITHDRLNNLAECTGDARLFKHFAAKAGVETKVVYAVNLPEYTRVCPVADGPELKPYYDNCTANGCDLNYIEAEDMGAVRLNGHQAVAVRENFDSAWRIINTSNVPGDAVSWATQDVHGKNVFEKTDYREMISSDKRLQVVYFHFKKNGMPLVLEPHFIAYIGEDIAFNHAQLMSIYTRGKPNSHRSCVWSTEKKELF